MELKKENIDKIIQYINLELKKNDKLSVNKICDKIGIKQSTFKTWAHKAGYSFDINIKKYIKVIQKDNIKNTKVQTKIKEENNLQVSTSNINKYEEKTKVIQKYNELDINKLKDLIELLGPLKEIVKEHNEKIKPKLNPSVITEVKQKLFKVDIKVLEEWEEFVQAHKQFKVQNLISLALKEFIEKYK